MLADGAQHFEAGDAGHPQIDQHQIGRPLAQLLHGVGAVDGRRDVEPFRQGDGADQRQDRAVVVDDEYSGTAPHPLLIGPRGGRLRHVGAHFGR